MPQLTPSWRTMTMRPSFVETCARRETGRSAAKWPVRLEIWAKCVPSRVVLLNRCDNGVSEPFRQARVLLLLACWKLHWANRASGFNMRSAGGGQKAPADRSGTRLCSDFASFLAHTLAARAPRIQRMGAKTTLFCASSGGGGALQLEASVRDGMSLQSGGIPQVVLMRAPVSVSMNAVILVFEVCARPRLPVGRSNNLLGVPAAGRLLTNLVTRPIRAEPPARPGTSNPLPPHISEPKERFVSHAQAVSADLTFERFPEWPNFALVVDQPRVLALFRQLPT